MMLWQCVAYSSRQTDTNSPCANGERGEIILNLPDTLRLMKY